MLLEVSGPGVEEDPDEWTPLISEMRRRRCTALGQMQSWAGAKTWHGIDGLPAACFFFVIFIFLFLISYFFYNLFKTNSNQFKPVSKVFKNSKHHFKTVRKHFS
jgi:hypothetical protein